MQRDGENEDIDRLHPGESQRFLPTRHTTLRTRRADHKDADRVTIWIRAMPNIPGGSWLKMLDSRWRTVVKHGGYWKMMLNPNGQWESSSTDLKSKKWHLIWLIQDITFRHSMHLTARNWLGLRLNSGGLRRFSQLSVQWVAWFLSTSSKPVAALDSFENRLPPDGWR